MDFKDFSYSETANSLFEIARKGCFSHALLIEGDAGSGKRELAFLLAKTILFDEDKKEVTAASYQNGLYPDLFFYDGNNKGDYSAENLRKIKEEVYISPWVCEKKVFILANYDKCDPKYSNILLKCIEEPPSFVHFILTAPSKNLLLETIVSRVSDYKLLPPPISFTKSLLISRGISAERAEVLSTLFDGNIGLSKSACEDENFARLDEIVKKIIVAIFGGEHSDIALSLSPLYGDKNETLEMLLLLERYFLMLAKENVCQNSGLSVIIGVEIKDFSHEKLYLFARIFRSAADKFTYNGNLVLSITAMQAQLFAI